MEFNNLTQGDIALQKGQNWPICSFLSAIARQAREKLNHEEESSSTNNTNDHIIALNITNLRVENELQPLPLPPPEVLEYVPLPPTRAVLRGENGPQSPPPPLPHAFSNAIRELSGAHHEEINYKLVIQKELCKTDTNPAQNRFSIPFNKMSCGDFLTEHEKNYLCTRDDRRHLNFLDVKIIEPSLGQGTVKLRRWEMKKESGNSSVSYVLTGDWTRIVERNVVDLKEGKIVQLWACRIDGELYFAMVRLT